MSLFGNKAIACLLLDQVVNNGVFGVVDDTVDANFIGRYPDRPEPVRGTEEYKQYIKERRHTFPDLHVKIDDGWLTGEDDAHAVGRGNVVERVVAVLTVSGTLRHHENDVSDTGRHITWSEVHLFQCRNGRIVGDRVVSDLGALLAQLNMPATV